MTKKSGAGEGRATSFREDGVMRGACGLERQDGSFTLLEGSQVKKRTLKAWRERSGKVRATAEADGTIVDGVLTRDMEFDDRGEAASFVYGRYLSGADEWSTPEGLTVREHERRKRAEERLEREREAREAEASARAALAAALTAEPGAWGDDEDDETDEAETENADATEVGSAPDGHTDDPDGKEPEATPEKEPEANAEAGTAKKEPSPRKADKDGATDADGGKKPEAEPWYHKNGTSVSYGMNAGTPAQRAASGRGPFPFGEGREAAERRADTAGFPMRRGVAPKPSAYEAGGRRKEFRAWFEMVEDVALAADEADHVGFREFADEANAAENFGFRKNAPFSFAVDADHPKDEYVKLVLTDGTPCWHKRRYNSRTHLSVARTIVMAFPEIRAKAWYPEGAPAEG